MGGSYLPLDRHTLMCIGAYPASTAVYALDLHSLILTALLSFSTYREAAGVAKSADSVFVFGGLNGCSLSSCEQYSDLESFKRHAGRQELLYTL